MGNKQSSTTNIRNNAGPVTSNSSNAITKVLNCCNIFGSENEDQAKGKRQDGKQAKDMRRRIILGGTAAVVILVIIIAPAVYFGNSSNTDQNEVPTLPTYDDCPAVPDIEFGEISCSNGVKIGSICEVHCNQNHILQGQNNPICQNGAWSRVFPTCVCRECYFGDECDLSTSVSKAIEACKNDRELLAIVYEDHVIKCNVDSYITSFKLRFRADCHDVETPTSSVSCKGYASDVGACEHAFTELVRQGVARGVYSTPCDVDQMIPGCGPLVF